MAGLKTILFIEDDHVIAEMYRQALDHAGYDVTVAVTGPEGLEQAKTGKFDAVMLDILLPQKTGIEILEELRGRDGAGLPNTKIIVLTNFEQDDSSRADMERLADGYLIKADITPRKLIDLLKQFDADEEKHEKSAQ